MNCLPGHFDFRESSCFGRDEVPTNIVLAHDLVSSMLASRLFTPESELDKNQSGMLKLNPRYLFPTTLSGAQHIYLKLTEVVAYCPERQDLRIHVERSEERNNTLCVYGGTILLFGFDLQIIGTNRQTLGRFPCAPDTGTEFHDVFQLEPILLDVSNVLDTSRLILALKGNKMRFLPHLHAHRITQSWTSLPPLDLRRVLPLAGPGWPRRGFETASVVELFSLLGAVVPNLLLRFAFGCPGPSYLKNRETLGRRFAYWGEIFRRSLTSFTRRAFPRRRWGKRVIPGIRDVDYCLSSKLLMFANALASFAESLWYMLRGSVSTRNLFQAW